MSKKLTENFLVELIKCCTSDKGFIEAISPHIKYSFFPSEPYKKIFQQLIDHHGVTGKALSLGQVAQKFNGDSDILKLISQANQIDVAGKQDATMEVFEEFIKRARFVTLHKDVEELYNQGKHDEALEVLAAESKDINEFSLMAELHTKVFQGFDKWREDKKNREHNVLKIPTGIPQFDHYTRGGIDVGTGLLAIGRSGAGKSTYLRQLGYWAAFHGFNVVHFQAEGTEEECLDAYNSMWTGIDKNKIKYGSINSAVDNKKIDKARKAWLANAGEIHIVAFEQFDQASIFECRTHLVNIMKNTEIHLVLFDYLEKFDPGNKVRYGAGDDQQRHRKLAVAEKIINIGTEFKVAVATATQSNEVPKEIWNDPTKVLTRSNISNLKATIDAFAYCVTLNQTEDEDDQGVIRIHEEKQRHYKTLSWQRTYYVAQAREIGRFVNASATNMLFWDPVNKKKRNESIAAEAGIVIGENKD